MVKASVLGIGVAVIDSRCGVFSDLFIAKDALCLAPKRCCSSIITSAKFLNLTLSCIKECVPIRMGISPLAVHFKSWALEIFVASLGLTLEGNFWQPEEVIRPILGVNLNSEKYSIND